MTIETNPLSPETPVAQTPPPLPETPKNKTGLKLFGLGVLGVVFLTLVGGYFFVKRQVTSVSLKPGIVKAAEIFNMPAAKINGTKITYAEYVQDLNALTQFYKLNSAAPAPSDESEVSKQVLIRLFDNILVLPLAKQYSVSVSDNDVEVEKQKLLAEFPDQTKAEEEVKKFYNWDLDTYLNRIVKPFLLTEKVQQAFVSSTDNFGEKFVDRELNARHILFPVTDEAQDAKVKAEAEKILTRASKGEDFEKLAKQYTIETERDEAGQLPWFGRGRMIPEFEDAAFALKPGEVSGLIRTAYGYHIIKLDEERNVRSFSKLMDSLARDANVKMYIDVVNPFDSYKAVTSSTTSALE